jgi:hypothetical protein
VTRTASLRISVVILAVVLAASCATAPPGAPPEPQTWIERADGGITYVPLGIEFPARFEHLAIGSTHAYDPAGLDVSVGYQGTAAPFTLTFYAYLREYYPHPTLLDHFQAVVGDVLQVNPGAEVLDAFSISFTFENVTVDGYLATFAYSGGPYPDGNGIALLLPYGEFYLYVRASFPGAPGADSVTSAVELIDRFLLALRLPGPAI